jgi:hypothetical protein
MNRSLSIYALLAALLPVSPFAQAPSAEPAPISIPSDKVAESYRIYSSLIPLGETANKGWPHDLWLIQETTVALVSIDQPCAPDPTAKQAIDMNPHFSVHPPEKYAQDFIEIMSDFDAHCHDRALLDANAFNLTVPVHLLTPEEQKEFRDTRSPALRDSATAAKFKGAPALYGFSEVYFNASHSVALVYATHWCGGLCGEGFWVPLTLEKGKWKQLSWNSDHWIS